MKEQVFGGHAEARLGVHVSQHRRPDNAAAGPFPALLNLL